MNPNIDDERARRDTANRRLAWALAALALLLYAFGLFIPR